MRTCDYLLNYLLNYLLTYAVPSYLQRLEGQVGNLPHNLLVVLPPRDARFV